MVSPIRPLKHQSPNLARVCCWDRDTSWTKLIFSWFMCLKNDIFCVRMFRRYVSCEKWVQYVSWWRWGKRIGRNLWCSLFSWMNRLKTASSLLSSGARVKPMWHWYRKWTISRRSRFLVTVSGITAHTLTTLTFVTVPGMTSWLQQKGSPLCVWVKEHRLALKQDVL